MDSLWGPPRAACCLEGLGRRSLRPCRPPGSSGPGSRALLPVPIGSAALLARDVPGRRFSQLPGSCWGPGDAICHEAPPAQSSPASRTVHFSPRFRAGKVRVLTQGFPLACGLAGAGHVTRAPPPPFCPEPAGLAGGGPVGCFPVSPSGSLAPAGAPLTLPVPFLPYGSGVGLSFSL